MSECMQFPDTWEEFEQAYGFEDKKEIYTNGSRLIQSFRVKQWLDHTAEPERKTGKWIEQDDGWYGTYYECSCCKEAFSLIDGTPADNLYNFCPNCGADMRGDR